jgi:hypothetical protein
MAGQRRSPSRCIPAKIEQEKGERRRHVSFLFLLFTSCVSLFLFVLTRFTPVPFGVMYIHVAAAGVADGVEFLASGAAVGRSTRALAMLSSSAFVATELNIATGEHENTSHRSTQLRRPQKNTDKHRKKDLRCVRLRPGFNCVVLCCSVACSTVFFCVVLWHGSRTFRRTSALTAQTSSARARPRNRRSGYCCFRDRNIADERMSRTGSSTLSVEHAVLFPLRSSVFLGGPCSSVFFCAFLWPVFVCVLLCFSVACVRRWPRSSHSSRYPPSADSARRSPS